MSLRPRWGLIPSRLFDLQDGSLDSTEGLSHWRWCAAMVTCHEGHREAAFFGLGCDGRLSKSPPVPELQEKSGSRVRCAILWELLRLFECCQLLRVLAIYPAKPLCRLRC